MSKSHHTKRLLNTRKKLLKIWKDGRIKAVLCEPTPEEIKSFVIGLNMGYKAGYRNALNPKKQASKWKPVLDALFRFKDPISFVEAMKQLGCTEKALHKKIDNYEYWPTAEDMHILHEQEMETLKEIEKVCNENRTDH